ncbi:MULTISPECIES: rod shape-determining protein MreC [Idiomarina]|uniref:rod shape-determining protein MreC n=1 Tax=Idiomarina TaxID=135575 RepID=UPI00129C9FB5|nr:MULTISPECIES: rod shape-determining protein MreC [Idiomarina]MRJ42029.1 rod shape-determining protein MreC [Idiomarina sp. FeN1]NCU57312.1 rod shape-determining protein MreC [Idiomarina sp. FenA--70]NCU60020.1 rod shape-determining protein MreC [Idiomarina sp. FenBw--71]UUN12927.1 rod shape-determining protein MreC [Idiomarina loihiensis]
MKSLFERGPTLLTRLVLALSCALTLMFLDHRLNTMQPVRSFMSTLIAPVQYLAVLPEQVMDRIVYLATTRTMLRNENKLLKQELEELQMAVQRLNFLENENDRLRQLLGSDVREASRRMAAEVVAVATDPFSHQLVINKGLANGVYEGQPVLDNRGVVGQVMSVGRGTARVLLIADQSQAISLRAERNDIRVLAKGTGDLQQLELQFIPHSTDLEVGDKLVSSGLGGIYPEGYPVAEIISIDRNERLQYARVLARPYAQLDRVRTLLLLWPADATEQPVYDTEEETAGNDHVD